MRTLTSLLKGGNSGPAIIPGKPNQSLILKRIMAEEMPPLEAQANYSVRPITSRELVRLRQWITDGNFSEPEKILKDDDSLQSIVKNADQLFWSFQSPIQPQIGVVSILLLMLLF